MNIKLSLVSVLFFVLILSSCTDTIHHKNIDEKLENSEERNEVFEAICKDKEYMKYFSTYMVDNNYYEGMPRHPKMMRHMMGNNEHMVQIMKNDTAMCSMLMGSIMEISKEDSNSCKMMCKAMMKNKHIMNMREREGGNGRKNICCPIHQITNSK